jgi:hypothetical protein
MVWFADHPCGSRGQDSLVKKDQCKLVLDACASATLVRPATHEDRACCLYIYRAKCVCVSLHDVVVCLTSDSCSSSSCGGRGGTVGIVLAALVLVLTSFPAVLVLVGKRRDALLGVSFLCLLHAKI